MAERLDMPYRMPVLRGHCTRPEDLCGVSWRDWYDDAATAMRDLRTEADQIIICGLSMGGLVALHLAADHPQEIAGVATIAAALQIADPLIRFSPVLARLFKMWKGNPAGGYADAARIASNTNYTRFATDALVSLYRYTTIVTNLLPKVQAPLLVIHSRRDRIIKPSSAETIYRQAGSRDKQLRWFDVSGHEMLQDCEADAVVAEIEQFITALKRNNRSVLA
jgi:carboxylesterase